VKKKNQKHKKLTEERLKGERLAFLTKTTVPVFGTGITGLKKRWESYHDFTEIELLSVRNELERGAEMKCSKREYFFFNV